VTPSLSIVLPAYNEADNLPGAVARALAATAHVEGGYEVIVVDDGSVDGTGEVARRLVEEHGGPVRLMSHARNLGKGAALRTGFENARGELVFFTDSDNQCDPDELRHFIPTMEENDLAIGFRLNRSERRIRTTASWFYNLLVGVLFRLRVRDVNCPFKLMRREVIDQIGVECDGFFIDTEIVARARKGKFRIAQKGVRHYPRTAGETTVHRSDVPQFLKDIARMWRRIYFPARAQRGERAGHERLRRELVTEYLGP
jgi:dolichol-phosphate mannosyltransferase